jgi:hypothetical protein
MIQPTFVVDDGENLTELPLKPFEVPAKNWETFKEVGLDRVKADILKKLEETPEDSTEEE